jgi:hypothetical protein
MQVEYDKWCGTYRASTNTILHSFKERLIWVEENIYNDWSASFWAYSGDKEWWLFQLHQNDFFELSIVDGECCFVFINSEDTMKYKLVWG